MGVYSPNIIGKLSTITTTKANATNPIHGVDGSPVVKDIYFDDTPNNSLLSKMRTVLISGLVQEEMAISLDIGYK